jgi:hypothetical protein
MRERDVSSCAASASTSAASCMAVDRAGACGNFGGAGSSAGARRDCPASRDGEIGLRCCFTARFFIASTPQRESCESIARGAPRGSAAGWPLKNSANITDI